MESLLQDILAWVELHPHAFSVAVFITALAESLVILGLVIPGAALLFGIGALVATGALPVVPIMLWTAGGALAGDFISFLLGHHYHQRLRVIWPFRRYPRLVNRGVDFFVRHGGKSVFMARFIGPLRPVVPAIAGMMNMTTARFLAVDILASLLWAPAYILPGMVFGASLGLAAEVAGRLVVLLVFVAAVIWLGFWVISNLIRLLQPHAAALLEEILSWSRGHPLIRPLAGSLLDPEHPEARGLAILSVLFFLTLWLLLLISGQVLHGRFLAGIDAYVLHTMEHLRTPWVDSAMVFITQFGGQMLLGFVLAGSAAWLFWTGCSKAAWHWLATYLSTGLLTWVLKTTVRNERPGIPPDSYSFPSAHTSMSLAVYGFLALMIARELAVQRRWLPYTTAGLIVVSIAFSRLYLGVHWFSDVLAGLSLGLVWVALLGIAYDRHPGPRLPVRRLLLVFVLLLAAAGSWETQRRFDTELARYAPRLQIRTVTRTNWLASDWRTLPAYRVDLEGQDRQPMNFQWAGPLAGLQARLEDQGWWQPRRPDPVSAINWLAPAPALAELPVLPQVNDGQHQQLLLAAPLSDTGNRLLIVRLWPSTLALRANHTPVWVGNAAYLRLEQDVPLLSFLRTAPDFETPLAKLGDALATAAGIETVRRSRRAAADGIRWQGQVLLGWEAENGP
ncbi:MAG: phosphatase PAP2 family protein [Gammaproteobacteria bacterium]|jgi:undecaprenyl-diphosphatase